MCPELFKIPFTSLTVKSYGLMLVIGFIAAIYIIGRLSRYIGHNPDQIKTAALYAMISGLAGARIFYVIHYWADFRNDPVTALYIWQGGLELLGGVFAGAAVMIVYMKIHKLPIRRYLDILAIGLMIALAFGRIGCFLNGCCYGKPADVAWSVRFPYGSIPYKSQSFKDLSRGRTKPYFTLPDTFFLHYFDRSGTDRVFLKPANKLSDTDKQYLRDKDLMRSLAVHPTQLYSSLNAFVIFVILYFFWKRTIKAQSGQIKYLGVYNPGVTFSLMFAMYGPGRFVLEAFRDGNPYEVAHLTISQLLGMGLFVVGIAGIVIFSRLKPPASPR